MQARAAQAVADADEVASLLRGVQRISWVADRTESLMTDLTVADLAYAKPIDQISVRVAGQASRTICADRAICDPATAIETGLIATGQAKTGRAGFAASGVTGEARASVFAGAGGADGGPGVEVKVVGDAAGADGAGCAEALLAVLGGVGPDSDGG